MSSYLLEFSIFSIYMFVFCLWNGAFNKKTAKHVLLLSLIGLFLVVPLTIHFLRPLFSSQLPDMIVEMILIIGISCSYLYKFKKDLFERKRDILYLAILSVALIPFVGGVLCYIVFIFPSTLRPFCEKMAYILMLSEVML